MRRGGGGGRGGGGLYGNFVSANDNVMNKAYRGAEIPPPPSLNAGNNTSNSVRGGGAPRLGPNTPIVGITTAAEGNILIALLITNQARPLPLLCIEKLLNNWLTGLAELAMWFSGLVHFNKILTSEF